MSKKTNLNKEDFVPSVRTRNKRTGLSNKEKMIALKLEPYKEEVIETLLTIMRSDTPKSFEAAKLFLSYMDGQPDKPSPNIYIDKLTSIELNNILDFGTSEQIDVDSKNNE